MGIIGGRIAPLAGLIDRIVSDPRARDAATLELLKLEGRDAGPPRTPSAFPAEARPIDPWTSRARPTFLYVMYVLLLWAIPIGLIAAVRPAVAQAIAAGMSAYLNGIPEPLYALFGTGYLGYTAARTWGKAKGVER